MSIIPLILICGGMLIILAAVSFLSGNASLNGIKSRKVGDGQHGTARFATTAERKRIYKHIPYEAAAWQAKQNMPQTCGLIVGSLVRGKKTTALVDDSDVHALMVGASGIGKTAYFLYPNLLYACACGMSFLASDTKGDLARNIGGIAQKRFGYEIIVVDLRNPARSNGFNPLSSVSKYMDLYLVDEKNIAAKAKAEKHAKIIAKTIISASKDSSSKGQNAYFYDAAEGLLTSAILLVAELCPPEKRHIVSVFKLIQDLMAPSRVKGKNQFQVLIDKLSSDHKARWFAGSALGSAEQAMASVLSTAMSRLNVFLDTELEILLCFGTDIDAEKFCQKKTAIFLILPEEDPVKYFLVSLIIQQLYRELLALADLKGGRLGRRVMFYLDELGTLPPIDNIEMMFSASRSRNISIVAIVQSFAQLEQNYGKDGAQIIIDNTQLTIFGGFAPSSQSAEKLSDALGKQTVSSGSINKSKDHTGQSLQMIARPLMTVDELKVLPRGQFIVMKTGAHPMQTEFRLYKHWVIEFGEPFQIKQMDLRKVEYADKAEVEKAILKRYPQSNRHATISSSKSPTGHVMQESDHEIAESPEVTVHTDW